MIEKRPQAMAKSARGLKSLFSSSYHKLRNTPSIWRNVINREAVHLFNAHRPKLSDRHMEIVATLSREGIAVAHATDFISEEAFQKLRSYAENRWQSPGVQEKFKRRNEQMVDGKLKSKGFFLVDLWESDDHILDLENQFIQFSLNRAIIDVINTYLELAVKFWGWHLQVTVPMPGDMRAYASQMWHRDPEDVKFIKTFLYLNDVDEGSGPFTYLKYSQIGGKWRYLFPQKLPGGSAGDPDKIPHEDAFVATGKAGTFILCDTSGLHRGGHAKTANRFMYTSIYPTKASIYPHRFVYPDDFNFESIKDPFVKYAVKH